MKTIKEYLEELPEPWRSQALENYDPKFHPHTKTTSSLESAISWAFDWSESPEGHEYWSTAHDSIIDGKPLVPEPEETFKHFCDRQIHALEVCRWLLGEKKGRSPTDLELIEEWVDGGYAEKFRNGEIGE
jgi:hypothetical protein